MTGMANRKRPARIAIATSAAILLVCSVALGGCDDGHEDAELQIWVAHSAGDAIDDAQDAYSDSHGWISFADSEDMSSGNIVVELGSGAYGDVFFSATEEDMDAAEESGLVISGTRQDVFEDSLVVIAAEGSGLDAGSLGDIVSSGYTLCIGDSFVVSGIPAAQALYSVGAYTSESGEDGVFSGIEPIVATETADIVSSVTDGDADFGLVLSSDFYQYYPDEAIEIAFVVDPDAYDSIIYSAAVCSSSLYPEEAQDFIEWCVTDGSASGIWEEWGLALVG